MIKEILSGWKNYWIKDPVIESTAKKRASICDSCEFKKKGNVFANLKIKGQIVIEERNIPYCGICSCPLVAKTRSRHSTCPKNKW